MNIQIRNLLIATVLLACVTASSNDIDLTIDFESAKKTVALLPEGTKADLTKDKKEVVDGRASLKGKSKEGGKDWAWTEYFKSKFLFKKNESYSVSFDYKILSSNTHTNFYVKFLPDNGKDYDKRGNKIWKGVKDAKGSIKTVFYTHPHTKKDYRMILGIKGKGAIAIDNIKITPGNIEELTLSENSQNKDNQWNEYFHSEIGLFKPGKEYKITLDYKVHSVRDDDMSEFYVAFRRLGDVKIIQGRAEWKGKDNKDGQIITSLKTGDFDDYYMVLGVKGGGKITVDNIKVGE